VQNAVDGAKVDFIFTFPKYLSAFKSCVKSSLMCHLLSGFTLLPPFETGLEEDLGAH